MKRRLAKSGEQSAKGQIVEMPAAIIVDSKKNLVAFGGRAKSRPSELLSQEQRAKGHVVKMPAATM